MSYTLSGEHSAVSTHRDIALGVLFASTISLGVFLLVIARSRGASVLDTKLALGSLAIATLCIIVAPSKLSVLTVGVILISAYSMTALLIRLIQTLSPIAGIAEMALGATMLLFRPPGWHKSYFRLLLPALLLLHGAYQFLHR